MQKTPSNGTVKRLACLLLASQCLFACSRSGGTAGGEDAVGDKATRAPFASMREVLLHYGVERSPDEVGFVRWKPREDESFDLPAARFGDRIFLVDLWWLNREQVERWDISWAPLKESAAGVTFEPPTAFDFGVCLGFLWASPRVRELTWLALQDEKLGSEIRLDGKDLAALFLAEWNLVVWCASSPWRSWESILNDVDSLDSGRYGDGVRAEWVGTLRGGWTLSWEQEKGMPRLPAQKVDEIEYIAATLGRQGGNRMDGVTVESGPAYWPNPAYVLARTQNLDIVLLTRWLDKPDALSRVVVLREDGRLEPATCARLAAIVLGEIVGRHFVRIEDAARYVRENSGR